MDEVNSDSSLTPSNAKRGWIVVSMVFSPIICLVIGIIAILLISIISQGASGSPDPQVFSIIFTLIKAIAIAAIISIVLLFVCVGIEWIAYRNEYVDIASLLSLLVFLMPVFFCILSSIVIVFIVL